MVSLLIWRRGGDVVGRCDARCYLASRPECDCVCGGANHRAGLDRAIAQTREHADRWIARARAAGTPIDDYEIQPEVVQDPLFTL